MLDPNQVHSCFNSIGTEKVAVSRHLVGAGIGAAAGGTIAGLGGLSHLQRDNRTLDLLKRTGQLDDDAYKELKRKRLAGVGTATLAGLGIGGGLGAAAGHISPEVVKAFEAAAFRSGARHSAAFEQRMTSLPGRMAAAAKARAASKIDGAKAWVKNDLDRGYVTGYRRRHAPTPPAAPATP